MVDEVKCAMARSQSEVEEGECMAVMRSSRVSARVVINSNENDVCVSDRMHSVTRPLGPCLDPSLSLG